MPACKFFRLATAALAAVVITVVACGTASAGTYYVYSCSSYGNGAPAFTSLTGGTNWNLANECGAGRSLEINQYNPAQNGKGSAWVAYSPSPAIAIVGATTPANTVIVDCMLHTDGFQAAYSWSSGGSRSISSTIGCSAGSLAQGTGIDQAFPASNWFGWGATCTNSTCWSQASGRILGVQGIRLTAEENTGPALDAVPASNLWYQSAWVRGSWPVTLNASDPSGVCWLLAAMDGKLVGSWSDPSPDTSRFVQCHGSQLPGQLNTTSYSDGQHTLGYGAYNAAGVPASVSKTISIDNAPVNLSLSGPTDALATAGTQYVNATGSAGPSGVGAILCSVDGAPYQRYGGPSTQVPVSGMGAHRVDCYAQNNAVDPSGAPATSPTQTWNLTIREPTVSAVAFTRVVDALRCRAGHERVRVPGRWVTVSRHHKLVRVRKRAHWKTIRVTRCHPRTAWRREVVWKVVRRHGKLVRIKQVKEVRVVLLPKVVGKTTRHVAFGRETTVSGWLGMPGGTALAGQRVAVYTAPDDDQNHFTQLA